MTFSARGVAYRRRPPRSGAATFCVTGAARGGTSMTAGLLRLAGLFMGDDIDPDNHEDRGFTLHGGDVGALKDPRDRYALGVYVGRVLSLIERRNEAHARWGWKDPAAVYYAHMLHGYLRNPHYIVITRDPLAVARGEHVHGGEFVIEHIREASRVAAQAVSFIDSVEAPGLILSYERALRHPAELVDELLWFTAIEATAEQRQKMIEYVAPERGAATF